MTMNGYLALAKTPALQEPYHHVVECYIQDTRWGTLLLLQSSSRCVLQLQPTGPEFICGSVNLRESSVMYFCMGYWKVSGLSTPYSQQQAGPIGDDQTLIAPTIQVKAKEERKKWLFIHLDDYRPLIHSSNWLLQTTYPIRGTFCFSDLRGHKHFFNI